MSAAAAQPPGSLDAAPGPAPPPRAGSLAECSFAELDTDPVATLRRIYQKLSWTDEFGAAVPAIRAYCSQLKGFRKNDHASLSVGIRARLERECGGVLAALGYRKQY